ncbi:1-aminocyclopropane-1-carboxylate oxidase homolog 1-like [Salvia miltiorrhiza]|uniref:1-aminocyclopropane-1-carboxylate oxidase homolog 1-like n=1 Tax=Salvia miltiorrhiza TaxID=226208 RepID=UPI0025AC53E4|nr:1-aminocyclopropane-1-carboxylate oxidase homolog 1-like [Salvia miltiorrhiza]
MANYSNGDYDWATEVKKLQEAKTGVKGLVDAGVTELPRLFVHTPEDLHAHPIHGGQLELPTIDLSGAERGGARRREVVEEIGKAAAEWGFFRLVNHGIPVETMDAMLEAVKRFHELPAEEKTPFYSSDIRKAVKLNSSLPVKENDPACWRDILTCNCRDDRIDPLDLPKACREEVQEYAMKHMVGVKEMMSDLLSEALGLPSDYLSNLECMKSQLLACLYYPPCPDPHKTLGTQKHSDSTFLTILMQDNIGGLQILHDDQWVDVPPVHGGLVANIGDQMQIISNGKFMSAQHRVWVQESVPRVSVASFFSPSARAATTKAFGPIKELLSDDNKAAYKDYYFLDFMNHYKAKGERVASPLHYYKI